MDVRTLWELQEVDMTLDRLAQELAEIASQLEEPQTLKELRRASEQSRERVRALEVRQKDLELALESLNERLRELQERLYGGYITDLKEIQASQEKEAEMLRRRDALENELLEVMDELEHAREEARVLEDTLAQEEAAWAKRRDELLQRREALQGEHRSYITRRERILALVPRTALTTYERLRAQKHGIAVARLDERVCLACGVEVPVNVARQARSGDELVFCPTCGRILVP